MIAARIIRNLEEQIKAQFNIKCGFKLVFKIKGFQILIWVYDQTESCVNFKPLLLVEVAASGKIYSGRVPELELFLSEALVEADKATNDLTRRQIFHFLFDAFTRSYRQFGTFPPSLNGLD